MPAKIKQNNVHIQSKMHGNGEKTSLTLTALTMLSKLLDVSSKFVSCSSNQAFSSCNGCGYFFTSTDELKNAVDAFRFSTVAATNRYGVMNCWDVSQITDVNFLFYSELASDGGTEDSINEPL